MYNILQIMAFGDPANVAVAEPRLHHQLTPMELRYQDGYDQDILVGLQAKGHIVRSGSYDSGTSPVIHRTDDGIIHAKGDNRKPQSTPGGVGAV